MGIRHPQPYKIQAVEKALSRSPQTSLQEIADSLGVGYSTLGKWISKASKHALEHVDPMMKTKEKRPQDWSLEERLNMVLRLKRLKQSFLMSVQFNSLIPSILKMKTTFFY